MQQPECEGGGLGDTGGTRDMGFACSPVDTLSSGKSLLLGTSFFQSVKMGWTELYCKIFCNEWMEILGESFYLGIFLCPDRQHFMPISTCTVMY